MKKNLLLTVFFTFVLYSCSDYYEECGNKATQSIPSYSITPEEAKGIASDFLSAFHGKDTRSSEKITIKNVIPLHNKDLATRCADYEDEIFGLGIDTIMYIVNFEYEKGFMLVAADKRTEPVLALIEEGNYSFEDLRKEKNEGFLMFLRQTAKMDTEDIEKGGSGSYPGEWEVTNKKEPLLKTKWSQEYPYCEFCPNKTSGCVPIAVAQILSYYQPFDFIRCVKNGTEISTRTNWKQIISDCICNGGKLSMSLNMESSCQVAKLVRILGLEMDAEYKKNITSVSKNKAIEWFNNTRLLHATKLKSFDEKNIIDAIKSDKIIYGRGCREKVKFIVTWAYKEGHAWVFDGFLTAKRSGETKNMLHCNWGWGGSRNGYYLSKAFNTFYGAEILYDCSEGHNDKNCNYNYKYDLQYSIISR